MQEKVILIDGNNLLFRSYYATAYSGNFMKNSKGFPTNALYGFTNMINKIISEEEPNYILCAFDKGKTFRHDKYPKYKEGRIETPNELKVQIPIAKELCSLMGITYLDVENYEADDIIGTFSNMIDKSNNYEALIISSDKDLLQLISPKVKVKLLKQKGHVMMDKKAFKDMYKMEPIKMIDLKALMGDASDNIPGVKGVGEKTALSLLNKYGSLDNIYSFIDEIKGKLKEKLITDKENAYYSYDLATIYKEVPVNMKIEDLKYKEIDAKDLIEKYQELEFNSFIKSIDIKEKTAEKINYIKVKEKINVKNFAYYIEVDKPNYHSSNIIGCSIYDGKNFYYLDKEAIILNKDLFKNSLITFDLKKNIIVLDKLGIKTSSEMDAMIACYLLEYPKTDDLAYIALTFNENIKYYESIIKDNDIESIVLKSKFLYDYYNKFNEMLKNNDLFELYMGVEHKLIYVLSNMEINGISVDTKVIEKIKEEVSSKVKALEKEIYSLADFEFNINSPKQLSEVLYNKLGLKNAKNNSTAHDVLVKLKVDHPIINKILEYRNYNKLLTTYLDTFNDYVLSDCKIHTIYKQNITKTGRLSSIDPNLQNIPIKAEEGRNIRKAFIASENHILLSADYSQIELRILAHITDCKNLINSFNLNEDVHRHVASDIFSKEEKDITPNERRAAKAVIFGIIYGISSYGLGENLYISFKEAKKYIDKYLIMYPEVDKYQKEVIKFVKENGYVKTILNRKRTIDEINNTNYMIRSAGERMAINTPIQGSAADIIKLSMIEINKIINKEKLNTKMLLQVHDELIFDVPIEELDLFKNILKETMENIYKLKVPLVIDINYGNNWFEAK